MATLTASNKDSSSRKGSKALYVSILALCLASALAYVSWLGICTEACAKSHSYRLYGFTFEMIGMVYFPTLLLSLLLSLQYRFLHLVTGLMMASGIGAELFFMYVQKYKIGTWCPLCLSIAAMLLIAATAFYIDYYRESKFQPIFKGVSMNRLFSGSIHSLAVIIGFAFAVAGLGQFSELRAEEDAIKMNIAFGNQASPIDVFVFTDWICPACASLEPTFEAMTPKVSKIARLTFVDDPVHEATLNYTPYNLAFMVNNKPQYFKLRTGMHELANDIKAPNDNDISTMAAKYGVQLHELNYGAVSMGVKYFDHLIKKFDIEGTPTVIVYNRNTKKSKKLEGRPQIDEEKILKAIESLSKTP